MPYWRLFYIQIIKHSKYEQIAVSQQTQDIAIEAKRGTITDRDGNILAISATAYKVVMAPKLIDSEDLREKDMRRLVFRTFRRQRQDI